MLFSASEIVLALSDDGFVLALDEIFANRERGDLFDTCQRLMRNERGRLTMLLRDVLDEDDQMLLVATRYIELKSRWLQWNLVLNYRMMMTGTFDNELACRASSLSYIVGRIEPFIDAASLARINSLLLEPILTPA